MRFVAIAFAAIVVTGCGGDDRRGGIDGGGGLDAGRVDASTPTGAGGDAGGGLDAAGDDAGPPGVDGGPSDAGFDAGPSGPRPVGSSCGGTEHLLVRMAARFEGDGGQRFSRIGVNATGEMAFGGRNTGTAVYDTTTVTEEMYVVRLAPDGAVRWVWTASRPMGAVGAVSAVAVDDAGGVFVLGSATGAIDFGAGVVPAPAGMGDAFVLHLTPTGRLDWVRRFTGDVFGLGALRVVGSDAVVTVNIRNPVDLGDGTMTPRGNGHALVRYVGSTGAAAWIYPFGTPPQDLQFRLSVDAADQILLAWRQTVSLNSATIHAHDLRSAGTPRWTRSWTSTMRPRGLEDATLAHDGSGFVLFRGRGTFDFGAGPVMFDEILLAIDAAGDYRWANERMQDGTLVTDGMRRPYVVSGGGQIIFPCALPIPPGETFGGVRVQRFDHATGVIDGTVHLPRVFEPHAANRPMSPIAVVAQTLDMDVDLGTGLLPGDSQDPIVFVLEAP